MDRQNRMRAARPGSARSRARGHPPPPAGAARYRCARHTDAGARQLPVPATRGQHQPAGPVRARRAARGPTGSRSIPTRSPPTAPRRWTGITSVPTGGCLPTDCPRTAASRACCTCSTSTRWRHSLIAIPHTRSCDLAWLPDASAFYYTRYPAPGDGARGRGAVSSRRLVPPGRATIPRQTCSSSSRREGTLARRGPVR